VQSWPKSADRSLVHSSLAKNAIAVDSKADRRPTCIKTERAFVQRADIRRKQRGVEPFVEGKQRKSRRHHAMSDGGEFDQTPGSSASIVINPL
jgi:hypothetical protein